MKGALLAPLYGHGLGKLPGVQSLHRLLISRVAPKKAIIHVNDYLMEVTPSLMSLDLHLFIGQGHEHLATNVVKTFVRPGWVCVDGGAHIGYYTIMLSSLVGKSGRVYAFEPCQSSTIRLCRNISLNNVTNVVVMPNALGNKSGTRTLHILKDSCANSLNDRNGIVGHETVDVMRLDDVVRRVDFVKFDLEGNEALAVRGASRTLATAQMLLCEVSPNALKASGESPESLMKVIEKTGLLHLHIIDEGRRKFYRATSGEVIGYLKTNPYLYILCSRQRLDVELVRC